ncbi:TPA: hypothetical protein QB313_002054, partial [Pasteurella multocida]|nr:hypothetical protein [Pasteurella multocida]
GNDADHLTFYYSPDLSDVTTDLDFVDDIDIVLKFAYSLCEGSFNSMEWENHFFNRELISRVLDITIPLNNKTQIEIYQNEPFTPEELKHTTIKPHQEPEIITAQIVELQARIMELEKENEQLKNSVLVKNAVDYDEYAIYGHSTPAIEAVFGTIKRFWVNADVTQPDTVANVDVIEEWIDENYSVSKTIKEAIQKITRPEKARSLGRKS